MTLGFLSGSRNFCKLLWVSCEVLVLHGYARIHWVAKSCPRVRRHRTRRPRGTLAWRTAARSGLDVNLLEVVGVGLITCEGAGLVKRVHHRFATNLKEVEEVRQEVREVKDAENGEIRTAHIMSACG